MSKKQYLGKKHKKPRNTIISEDARTLPITYSRCNALPMAILVMEFLFGEKIGRFLLKSDLFFLFKYF